MTEVGLPILVIVILILLNGLFVAAEFAIIGVRPTRISQLAEEGNATAAGIKATLEDTSLQDRYIATAQLGITVASLGLGMYGEHAVAGWVLGPLERWFGFGEAAAHTVAIMVALGLLTFAHVVVGEMVPKTLALQYAERTALSIARVMRIIQFIFYPAVLVLNTIGNLLLRLFGIPLAAPGRTYSAEELELLVTESHVGGLVTDNEHQLVQNIFDFSERRVAQVMTPRRRVDAVPIDIEEAALRAHVAASPYSRFPVYERDIDHIVGLLLIKDFVRRQLQQPGIFELKALLRHMPVTPEGARVEQLLASFKRSHVHMALVVDEYGGTAGVVTLEDLVEEVVGEVHDEFDQAEETPLREVSPGVLLVTGELQLDEMRGVVPGVLPDWDEDDDLPDVDTVGGLVVGLLGRPPVPGDTVELNGVTFAVEQVAGLAVRQVRVTMPVEKYPQLEQERDPAA